MLGAVGSILGWALNQLGPDMERLACPQLADFNNSMTKTAHTSRNYADVSHSSFQSIPWRKVGNGHDVCAIAG